MRALLVILAAIVSQAALAAEPSEDAAEPKSTPRIFSETPPPLKSSATTRKPANTPATRPSPSGSTAAKPPKYVPTPFTVTLPSGTELTQALMQPPANWVDKMFPSDEQVYVEKFTDGKYRGIYNYVPGKLHGGAVTLYNDGGVSTLANYDMNEREGPVRRWEESKKRLFYADYKGGKPSGVVCLFRDDRPWFVQEYDRSDVPTEYLVKWNGATAEAIPHNRLPPEDLRETAAARDKIRELEASLTRSEENLKQVLRDMAREKIKEARQKRGSKSATARRDEMHKKQPAAKKAPQKNEKTLWRVALRATGL